MSLRSIVIGGVLAAAAIGCSNTGQSGPAYRFLRPEQLAFVCLAPELETRPLEHIAIPRSCCRVGDPSADAQASAAADPACRSASDASGATRALGEPALHALITQSTRGEIAAVDLSENEVLDSDRLVPGYTFLDSGGLPTAVVAPPEQPLSETRRGPVWTYVASAEDRQIRAIATCRFRKGKACGPELDAAFDATLTQLPLPAAPSDMVLGPDDALWVALPELGLLARVGLSADPLRPFALDSGGKLAQPRFHRVPVPTSVDAPSPVPESAPYLAVCGLGTDFAATPRALPDAPRDGASSFVRPTRLHFDESSGLLLVADALAPVLHVFALASDGGLTAFAALPTGVPVGDFVLTPPVPVTASLGAAVSDPSTRRYLYGLDLRHEGLIMVFEFAPGAPSTRPSLTPLKAPAPGYRYADRIEVGTPVVALEVVDTRSRSAHVCGADGDKEALRAAYERLRDQQPAAKASDIARAKARLEVYDDASASHLRGVFVVAASADGTLATIDVHDLDVACRAQKECQPSDLRLAQHPDAQDALAVRRHALRRRTAGELEASLSSDQLRTMEACPPASSLPEAPRYVSALLESGKPLVCVPPDPWSTVSENWSVQYQAVLDGLALESGILEAGATPQELVLWAPQGVAFCARGALPGDLVAVVGEALDSLANCPVPSEGSEPLLTVKEAFQDHFVLEKSELPLDPTLDDAARLREVEARAARAQALRAELLRCYPDFAKVEVRAKDYLVTGAQSRLYLHNVTADAQSGRCIEDSQKDARFTSRARADAPFQNLFVSFQLKPLEQNEKGTARETTVQVRGASTSLVLGTVGSTERSLDALPSMVRYLPELGDLFVLDSASQGLKRYTLTPFKRNDNSVVR